MSSLIVGSSLLTGAPLSPTTALAAGAWDGVPSLSADYDRDVESWWADHPFNPASSQYAPAIASPAHQVNVRTQFNGSIQSAINSLPASGGTLYFPAGTYTGGFNLIGKNHVHFVGEPGAIIKSGTQNRVLGCSMAGDYGTFSSKVKDRDAQALACATTGRIKDVYFKNITFDGGGSSLVAVYIAAARDIVFDNVTFQGFHDPGNHHRGIVTGNALLDNIWIRDSKFIGRERFALYLDGLHGGGVIDSTVEHGFSGGAFLFLTNDDFSRDINGDGRVDLPEQRSSQHVVVYRNQFKGSTYDLVSATGRQILVKDNTATGVISTLANFQAKSSHIDSKLTYGYKQNRVVGNRLLQARTFIEVQGAPTCPLTVNCAHVGEYQVRDNTMERKNTYQQPAKEVNFSTSKVEGPHVVSNNCVAGAGCSSSTPNPPAPTPTPNPISPPAPPVPPAPIPAPVSPPPSDGSNLITNGSLDAATSGYPTNWRARPSAAWDGSVKRDGAGSLRISGPAASTYSDQALTLKPSTTYTVSYWVKTQGVSGPGVGVRYAQLAPTTYVLKQGDLVKGTQDWKQVSFSFTTPATYADGRLDILWELSAGQAWIDELTVTTNEKSGDSPSGSSPAPVNLAKNSSFDTATSGYPTNWRARPSAAWDGSVKRDGAGSLRISGPAASTYSDQALTLKPSTTYTVSYWVKTQDVSGPGVSVRYAQLAPTTYVLKQGDLVKGTQDWKQVSFSFTTPATYADGRLDILWELSAGQAWIDELTIMESAES